VNAVTRAAEEPRPVLWASERRTAKSVKRLEGGGLLVVEGCE
jgi:hypothetical protein